MTQGRLRPALTDILLAGDPGRGTLAMWVWGTLGAASLIAAALVALSPGHMQDFTEVGTWFDAWGFGANNPYLNASVDVDYPPHAFLLLAPMGWLPAGIGGRLIYLCFNLAATVTAAYLLARWGAAEGGRILTRQQTWALAGIVLSMGTTRASIWLGQTIALAVCLALLALRLAGRRPAWAALCLALSSFKPHVAIGFALALLLTGHLRVLFLAGLLSGALVCLFGLTIGATPAETVGTYLANLHRMYSGAGHVMSVTSLREILDWTGGPVLGLWLHVALALVTLAWVVAAARRAAPGPPRTLVISMSCVLWSLMVLPHQRHSLMLMAPAWWLVIWPHTRVVSSRRARLWIVGLTLGLSVLDVPLLIRLAADALATLAPEAATVATAAQEASYALTRCLVAFFFLLITRALARDAGNSGATATTSAC